MHLHGRAVSLHIQKVALTWAASVYTVKDSNLILGHCFVALRLEGASPISCAVTSFDGGLVEVELKLDTFNNSIRKTADTYIGYIDLCRPNGGLGNPLLYRCS